LCSITKASDIADHFTTRWYNDEQPPKLSYRPEPISLSRAIPWKLPFPELSRSQAGPTLLRIGPTPQATFRSGPGTSRSPGYRLGTWDHQARNIKHILMLRYLGWFEIGIRSAMKLLRRSLAKKLTTREAEPGYPGTLEA
jgi:hypothetical protein